MAAPTDPATYYFTQGVLGVTVVVLLYICNKLYKSREDDRKEWRAEVKELTGLRLQDSKDTTKEVVSVVQANTQSNLLLAGKIEAVKGTGTS